MGAQASDAIQTDGTHLSGQIAHQINSLWADFSKQMGTNYLGQTTSGRWTLWQSNGR
jgi:hypothetical protein